MARLLSSQVAFAVGGRQDARTQVISVLSKEWPLSAKQIHLRIASSNGSDALSYSAVHKALGELLSQGAVVDGGPGYSLSKPFVESQEKWWGEATKNYSGKPPSLAVIPENSSAFHVFKGVIAVPYWTVAEIPPLLSQGDVVVEQWYFAWPAQMVSEEQHKQVMSFAKFGGKTILCRGNSPGDLHCLNYLKELIGTKFIAGASVADDCDVIAFRDFVINIYWPTHFKQRMARALASDNLAKAMKEIYDYVFYGDGAKLEIPVTITRNRAMAEQILADSLKFFEEKRS